MYIMIPQYPYYIEDNCIGIFAGDSYGGATYHWNKENTKV